MKDGYYFILIHGWLEFFKVENSKILGLDTQKEEWHPTLVCPKRQENLQAITIEEAKANYPELVTTNQRATETMILASIKNNFADKRLKK